MWNLFDTLCPSWTSYAGVFDRFDKQHWSLCTETLEEVCRHIQIVLGQHDMQVASLVTAEMHSKQLPIVKALLLIIRDNYEETSVD